MNGLKLILDGGADRDQRVLRDRRVRARALASRAAGGDARARAQRGAALALEQLEHINEYISAVQIGVTMTSIGDRRARRARAGAHASRARCGDALEPRRGGGDRGGRRLPADHHRAAGRPARWCPSSTRSTAPRRSRAGSRGRCRSFRVALPPVHRRADRGLERDPAAARGGPGRGARAADPRTS